MKPCIHGHVAGRFKDGRCRECQRLRNKLNYHAMPAEERKKRNAAWYAANKNHVLKYRKENKERDKITRRVHYAKRRAALLIKSAKHRAGKIGVPFDLNVHADHYQNVIDEGLCQATG